MDNKLRQLIVKNTKNEIKQLLKQVEENAIAKIDKALNSGALSEESDFLKLNALLARTLIESEIENCKIHSPDYVKEKKNLLQFI